MMYFYNCREYLIHKFRILSSDAMHEVRFLRSDYSACTSLFCLAYYGDVCNTQGYTKCSVDDSNVVTLLARAWCGNLDQLSLETGHGRSSSVPR
jgi:hypothetical protein